MGHEIRTPTKARICICNLYLEVGLCTIIGVNLLSQYIKKFVHHEHALYILSAILWANTTYFFFKEINKTFRTFLEEQRLNQRSWSGVNNVLPAPRSASAASSVHLFLFHSNLQKVELNTKYFIFFSLIFFLTC